MLQLTCILALYWKSTTVSQDPDAILQLQGPDRYLPYLKPHMQPCGQRSTYVS